MLAYLKCVGVIFLLLIVVVLARTFLVPSKQIKPSPHIPADIDSQSAARHLAGSIPFRTISYENGGTEEQKSETLRAFAGLHTYMRETFPRVYEALRPEVIGRDNLLFSW